MAINFQYNKTALQGLNKQLKMRERALPTIKNKESALRVEVAKAKNEMKELENKFLQKIDAYKGMMRLWGEFDNSLLSIADVKLTIKKIAGVKTPVLDEIIFDHKEFSLYNMPNWYMDGISILREIIQISIEKEVFQKKTRLLDYARKKTTQKVNLYEKVQIPGFQEAIRKIKRFLEDEENLSKSAMKIVKKRQEEMEEAV
ncbi:MAG: V-type ATP synthase subunit D [Bacteroidales bacterium]|nr:V-type ATP synthase subunit D [Bacteroidales bacterium]